MIQPKLRFKADDGSVFLDWADIRFDNLYEPLNNNTFSRDCLNYEGGETKNIHYGDILIKFGEICDIQNAKLPFVNADNPVHKYALLNDGDIVLADTAEDETVGKAIEIYNTNGDKVISGLHTIACRPRMAFVSRYLGYYMNSYAYHSQLKPYMQGIKVTSIGRKNIAKTMIRYPADKKEQQKIADFLSAIDTVIEKQQATVEAWEQRKKGVMQKLFNQEVRFKADDGSDFPDWEEGTVGTLFSPVVNKNKDGSVRNVITNSAEYGLIPQRDYFDKDIAIKDNTMNYTIIQKGDFVYNPRKSTTAPFGPFNMYEREEAGIVSPLYTCLKPNNKEMAPYLTWYFRTRKWHPYIVTHGAQSGARHDRVGMTTALMAGIPVAYPSFSEQQKIADCLSALGDVIKKQKEILEKWKELKKGLLQQMFV